MKREPEHKSYLCNRRFEHATWVLKDEKLGNITEYNSPEMRELVIEGYISYWNSTYCNSLFNLEKISERDLSVKCLHLGGAIIREIGKSSVIGTLYTQILPQYFIDCYDWNYQCKNDECQAVLNRVKGKEEKILDEVYCIYCNQYSSYP